MSEPLKTGAVRISGVSRTFKIVHERNPTLKEALLRRKRVSATDFQALDDVNLVVEPGEAVGIVGANGSGKSTLLKVIAGIIPPDSGSVETCGSVASMIELGAGFHPDFSGRENAYMNAAFFGLGERDVDGIMDEIVDFAEVSDFIDMPVRTYSSGMQMRLAFSIASHVKPDIMLLDEVLAVGDESFQRKCFGRIFEYRRRGGTIIFVSHDPSAVERICDRAIVLEHGRVVAEGPAPQAMLAYHQLLAGGATNASDTGEEWDAGDEWGNKKVVISDLQLHSNGRPARSVLSGEPITFSFKVQAQTPVESPIFGMAIKTPGGVVCFGTNTHMEGLDTGRIDGEHRVELTIPSLNLLDGPFVLHASASSADSSEVYHWVDSAWAFNVFPSRPGVGLVKLDPTWQIG